MTLRVTPNGQTFEKWVDDDCKELSNKMIYYGFKTKARDITYTAMFKGGAACTPITHGSEESGTANSSSSGGPESSSSVSVTELAEGLCSLKAGTDAWPSVLDMSNPEMGDGWTETNHEGYTGGGFFNLDNSAYSKATYMVTSDQSAEHARMMIRYAFSGTTSRDMKITVDNGTYDVVFPSTGSWDKWDTVYVDNVWVDALDFKVILQSATADGGPNIDMIAFDMKDVYRTGCKNVRKKDHLTKLFATTRPVSTQKNGFTVNALGQKVLKNTDRGELRKLPKGRYFLK
jgi:hypothetical protein